MTWSYDPATIATQPYQQVRLLIGDTLPNDPQLQDEEIKLFLTLDKSIWRAAANCCRAIASQLSRLADSVTGDIRTLYSSKAKAYQSRGAHYDNMAVARGGGLAYAGGISVADKLAQEANIDRVSPQFQIGMEDNFIPVGPAGNESSSSAAPVQE